MSTLRPIREDGSSTARRAVVRQAHGSARRSQPAVQHLLGAR